jgi:hypothetical protein
MTEIIPVELSSHRVGQSQSIFPATFTLADYSMITVDAGRVWFTAPGLFECSLSLTGTRPFEGWFFAHANFLFTIGGDATGTQGMYIYSSSSFISRNAHCDGLLSTICMNPDHYEHHSFILIP